MYRFAPPDKERPVLILTRTSILPYLGEVTIAPITSTIYGIPSEIRLGIADGLKKDCAINLDHIQTVSQSKVGRFISTLSSMKMLEVKSALLFALGFDE